MLLVFCVILATLVFTYTNGFHDTANSIATVVATKVLTPRQAIFLATIFNLIGALGGTAVANTIGKGLVDTQFITLGTLLGAMIAAISWNLLTWYFGLPSSSSHGLIGGLCGAALASSHGNWSAIIWSTHDAAAHTSDGILYKVIIPMILSPLAGLIFGFIFMKILYYLLRNWKPGKVHSVFGKLQLLSASYMGWGHGLNDAQKTMGIIVLALFTATTAGQLDNLPTGLKFLYTPDFKIPVWVQVLCGITMAAGTAAGGWRIIRTLGHKMVRLQPVHGFAAETISASILSITALFGMPASTTHVMTSSIMGVGIAKRFSALKLGLVERIVWAWVLTLPISGLLAYLIVRVFQKFGIQ
jgi:inorganic phosphate transporter, PiT family